MISTMSERYIMLTFISRRTQWQSRAFNLTSDIECRSYMILNIHNNGQSLKRLSTFCALCFVVFFLFLLSDNGVI